MVLEYIIIQELAKNMKDNGKMTFGMVEAHIQLEFLLKLSSREHGKEEFLTDRLKLFIKIRIDLKEFLEMVKKMAEAKFFMGMVHISKDNLKTIEQTGEEK